MLQNIIVVLPAGDINLKPIVVILIFLVFLASCHTRTGNDKAQYKGNFELLFSSGKYCVYNNGKLNLKLQVNDTLKKLLPDNSIVEFYDLCDDGICVVISEYIDGEIIMDNLVIYLINFDNVTSKRIMEFDGFSYSQFFIQNKILFCYFNWELIAIDIENKIVLWKKKLEPDIINVKNLFVDIESQFCIFSSSNYYLDSNKKEFAIMHLDGLVPVKKFNGELLAVDIPQKSIYYFDYDNNLASYNYETDQFTRFEIINIHASVVDQSMVLNRLYILGQDKYIFCYAKKRTVAVAKMIFPHSDSSFYDYIYFSATIADNNFSIIEQIKIDDPLFLHEQLKKIK